MKNMIKILLIIFFFIFSYMNGIGTSSIPPHRVFAAPVTNSSASIEKAGTESYIVLPANNSDNGFFSDISGVNNFNYAQKLNFNKSDCKNFDYDSIVHLFKTEVNPNAP